MGSGFRDDVGRPPACESPELLRRFDLDLGRTQDQPGVRAAVAALLQSLGEDPSRAGLAGTPERVARMYGELLEGYGKSPDALINGAVFADDGHHDMVVVRDIEFFSLCEHHLLPFFGKAHVAYVPDKRIIGLSKVPRIVDMFARRLQVQERLTQQIAGFLDEILEPLGVAVTLDGAHFCSMMRGVKQSSARMTTRTMLGSFREDDAMRMEFLSLIA